MNRHKNKKSESLYEKKVKMKNAIHYKKDLVLTFFVNFLHNTPVLDIRFPLQGTNKTNVLKSNLIY